MSQEDRPFAATGRVALKQATIAPATASMADLEIAPTQSGRVDPYLGCLIDDRYRVEGVLGEGGMGVVYRCTHKVIGKKVAMKVLRADLARDAEVMERFLNEAKAASAIGNLHIIDISDFGRLPDGSTYFVMEFLEGAPLTQIVEGGVPVPVTRILRIARQLAEGLAAAHAAGIVHRDLKPDNIFLIARGSEKDFVKILDFGIAKVSTSSEGKLTRAGTVFGTPHYMSPEQAAGAEIDLRCDIYAFGVILYELASGKVPFDADNFMGILTQHMYKAPVPIRALVPQPNDVPPGLEAIVLKCLSKRPEQRYATMSELLEDLTRLEEGLIPTAVAEMMQRSGGFNVPADYFKKGMPEPLPASPASGGRRRSALPLVAGAAGVTVAVGLVLAIFARSAASDAAPAADVVAAPAPTKPAEPAVNAAPTPPTAAKVSVALAVEPLDAHVFRGETDLGTSPVVLDVGEGEAVTVEVRRDGFRTESFSIDATQPRRSLKLERDTKIGGGAKAAAAKPADKPEPPPATKPKPKPKIGGGEIVDPWGN
ncbi:MAG: serine/threonine protein kinase [Polyangiaceae bacterium]|nr:serine/threonine protein kinase [Polyangiaceae bacterium]